jgi:hypothetical protein
MSDLLLYFKQNNIKPLKSKQEQKMYLNSILLNDNKTMVPFPSPGSWALVSHTTD